MYITIFFSFVCENITGGFNTKMKSGVLGDNISIDLNKSDSLYSTKGISSDTESHTKDIH